MSPSLAPSVSPASGPQRALRRLLREEDAWLLRQIGSERPILWLRPQPLGAAARHGIVAPRIGADGQMRGPLRASVDAWPWADDSLPGIVLQHVAEGAAWSGALLAEAARTLAPEGRLYLLRFDRLSPWYWRYGRLVANRSGARPIGRPFGLAWAHRFGLALEYRHALGTRGFRAASDRIPKTRRAPDRWPFASTFRASRVWVLRKRRNKLLLTPDLHKGRSARTDYGLAHAARRERGGSC